MLTLNIHMCCRYPRSTTVWRQIFR